jgi:putative redox protein
MGQVVGGTVELQNGETFRATNAAGNTIILEPSAAGGTGTGVSPMEVVLLGLGGCTGIDVISTLRKMRQDVTGYRIAVTGERRDEHPRVYTRILVEHQIKGRNLRVASIRRAIELSAGRYCSVSAMLERATPIEIGYRVVDTNTGQEATGTVLVQE